MPPPRSHWFVREILPLERELRAYARRFFPNDDDARDLVQHCYAQILAVDDPGTIQSARAYLFTTARNLAIQRLRHERVVPIDLVAEIDETSLPGSSPSAEEVSSAREELRMLTDAVAALPPQCRQVFTLRKVYGYSQKEIAEELGITEHTVEKHIAKGVRLCTDFLVGVQKPARAEAKVVTLFKRFRGSQ